MYIATETASTTIQINQFSIFFRASIQVATKLSAVVNESQYGKSELVNWIKIQAMAKNKIIVIPVKFLIKLFVDELTLNSLFRSSFVLP